MLAHGSSLRECRIPLLGGWKSIEGDFILHSQLWSCSKPLGLLSLGYSSFTLSEITISMLAPYLALALLAVPWI